MYLKPGTRILWFPGDDDEDHISVEVVSDDGDGLIIRDENGKEFDGSHGGYMAPVWTGKVSSAESIIRNLFGA